MTTTPLTILILEDIPAVRSALAASVQRAADALALDLNVLEAGCGVDAIRFQRTHKVDAVFVDLGLDGGINGYEAIEAMRDPFKRLFVLLVSGESESKLGQAVGALQQRLSARFEFIQKPASDLEIRSAVMKCRDFVNARPLPHPLAVAVQVARQGSNPTLQLHAIERALELIIKISVFFMASELAEHRVPALAGETGFTQTLTLGTWIRIAERLIAPYRQLGDNVFVPGLTSLLKQHRGGPIAVVRSFKPVRDAEIAHGFPTDSLAHEARVEQYGDAFELMLKSLGILRDLVWAAPEHVEVPAGAEFRYSLRTFMGESSLFDIAPLLSSERLHGRYVYAFNATLRPRCLYPYVLWRNCAECHRARLFLLENFADGVFQYKDTQNHLVADRPASTDLLAHNDVLTATLGEAASEH
jgi:CheY-like chemotaxis protein